MLHAWPCIITTDFHCGSAGWLTSVSCWWWNYPSPTSIGVVIKMSPQSPSSSFVRSVKLWFFNLLVHPFFSCFCVLVFIWAYVESLPVWALRRMLLPYYSMNNSLWSHATILVHLSLLWYFVFCLVTIARGLWAASKTMKLNCCMFVVLVFVLQSSTSFCFFPGFLVDHMLVARRDQ